MATTPAPVDPRGPRFNQGVLSTALLVTYVLDVRPAVPAVAMVLLAGAVRPSWGPFLRLYAEVIRPRLRPPAAWEDPRAHRFASAIGAGLLAASTLLFLADWAGTAWILALVVAVVTGLAATTGICVGCLVYIAHARRHGVRLAG